MTGPRWIPALGSRCRPSSLAFLLFGVLPRSVQPACKVHWLGFSGFFGFVDVQYTKACSSRCCFVCYFGLTEAQTFPVGRSIDTYFQSEDVPSTQRVLCHLQAKEAQQLLWLLIQQAPCKLLPLATQLSKQYFAYQQLPLEQQLPMSQAPRFSYSPAQQVALQKHLQYNQFITNLAAQQCTSPYSVLDAGFALDAEVQLKSHGICIKGLNLCTTQQEVSNLMNALEPRMRPT